MKRKTGLDYITDKSGEYLAKMIAATDQVVSLNGAYEERILRATRTGSPLRPDDPVLASLREGVKYYQGLVDTYAKAYHTTDAALRGAVGR